MQTFGELSGVGTGVGRMSQWGGMFPVGEVGCLRRALYRNNLPVPEDVDGWTGMGRSDTSGKPSGLPAGCGGSRHATWHATRHAWRVQPGTPAWRPGKWAGPAWRFSLATGPVTGMQVTVVGASPSRCLMFWMTIQKFWFWMREGLQVICKPSS
jgi:hypothetical protein